MIPVLAVLILVGVWFALGWRKRRRSQADLPTLGAPPATLGEPLLVQDLLYVATTRADAPLDRITVRGLAFRGRAGVAVSPEGVVLSIAGQPAFFIARDAIEGVGRATWTIDKVVANDGLVFIRWALGDARIDSYLKSTDPDVLLDALNTVSSVAKKPVPNKERA
ncbi:MAG: hypothetical protein ABIR17_00830 [Pseudolysinimonas sp.]|uniref:PH-like domain-containing protein n=1 Tax=Pseudolysinimonas sp. TaxID=2680009 RepID=UPI00326414F7